MSKPGEAAPRPIEKPRGRYAVQEKENQRCEREKISERQRTWLILIRRFTRILILIHLHPLRLRRPSPTLSLLPLSISVLLPRLNAHDPNPRQQQQHSDADHRNLKGGEGVDLAVVEEAGDDWGGVVETEGEGADEGGSDEAKGAVEVGQL
jgi:hypothetical protein